MLDREKRGDPPGGSGIHMDWYSLVSSSFKIIGFLGLIIVLSALLVRFSKRGFKSHRPRVCLKIVDSLPLGRDKILCVVEAGRSILLLGLTNNSVSLLKEFSSEEVEEMFNREEEGTNPKDKTTFFARFAENLGERMDKSRNPKTLLILILSICTILSLSTPAFAASNNLVPNVNISIDGEAGEGGLVTAIKILAALTVLTLAPAILILTTSFTRIAVVFSFLRAGLGTQQTPPNQVLIGIALLLTFFIMTPTWSQVNEESIAPYIAGEITAEEAVARGERPILDFMLRQTREKDLQLFVEITDSDTPLNPEDMSLVQVVPAFAISELKTAFEIGFLLFLPFLVIDMVIASALMSMGMLMLPPVLISLPFKILLFVLVDGWGLLTRSLINGFR